MLSLGGFVFEVSKNSFKEWDERWSFRWSDTKRIGQTSKLTYMGQENDTITLTGTLFAGALGNAKGVDALRELARSSKPLSVVDSRGRAYGDYVIVSIEKKRSQITKSNLAMKAEFKIALKRFE